MEEEEPALGGQLWLGLVELKILWVPPLWSFEVATTTIVVTGGVVEAKGGADVAEAEGVG